jgi:hypothetical protein
MVKVSISSPRKVSVVVGYTVLSTLMGITISSLLAKTDIEHSFKLIPIHPSNHERLWFSIEDKFYFEKTLPMGFSYSCNLFNGDI